MEYRKVKGQDSDGYILWTDIACSCKISSTRALYCREVRVCSLLWCTSMNKPLKLAFVCLCMYRFTWVLGSSTSMNLLYKHIRKGNVVCTILVLKFRVVELHRTSSNMLVLQCCVLGHLHTESFHHYPRTLLHIQWRWRQYRACEEEILHEQAMSVQSM